MDVSEAETIRKFWLLILLRIFALKKPQLRFIRNKALQIANFAIKQFRTLNCIEINLNLCESSLSVAIRFRLLIANLFSIFTEMIDSNCTTAFN